jgi:hypothetical protein
VFDEFDTLLGPVGAAKALHLLAPAFFPIWDRTIAPKYRCGLGNRGTNGRRYIRFMRLTAALCASLGPSGTRLVDVVKAIDEWNCVTFTRRNG